MTRKLSFMVALVLALVLARSASAQPADPLTLRGIAQLVDQAMPALNAVLNEGNPKAAPLPAPKLHFVTPAEFRKLPDPEVDLLVAARLPELSGKNRERAQEAARAACADVALARYRPGDDCITVRLPVDEQRIGKWSPVALPDRPELAANRTLQMAIVHEAVRQELERRYHWIEQMQRCGDEDDLRTWINLVEGRTLQATEAVADKLGAFAYAELLSNRYRAIPDAGPDPERLNVVRTMVFRQKHEACVRGKAFFAYLTAHGIKPSVALAAPPRQSLWLGRPELYVKAQKGGLPDLRKVLARLQGAPPAAKWTAAQQALGPEMVREVARMLKEEARADRVLQAWEEGRTLAFFAPDAMASVVISVARFETPAAARAYHGLSLDLQRKRDEILSSNCTATCKVLESRCETVEVPHSQMAVRCFKKVQYNAGRTSAADMVYVLAGSLVIEVDGFSAAIDPTWARQAVANIVAAFPAPLPPAAPPS
jgi:hypothetical protein